MHNDRQQVRFVSFQAQYIARNRYIKIFRDTGDIYTDADNLHFEKGKWFEREKKTDDPTVQFILYRMVEDNHSLRLREMRSALADFGIYISLTTIHRFWIDQNYTLKKITTIARESDETECYKFWNIFKTICTDINQCIWGDESHRDDKTANRKYGRAPK